MGLHKFHEKDRVLPIRVRNTLSFAPYLWAYVIIVRIKGVVKSRIIITQYN